MSAFLATARRFTACRVRRQSRQANVTYYRLENLSTEWQIGAYNSTNNPFGKVVRCQDCHMSNFPFAGNSSYQVGDLKITSPTPAVSTSNYAAVPAFPPRTIIPLQKRQVVNHYFTGVDVPLLYPERAARGWGPIIRIHISPASINTDSQFA